VNKLSQIADNKDV